MTQESKEILREKRAELAEVEAEIDEAVNERNFTRVATLNRSAAILRDSISKRESWQKSKS